MLVQPSAGDSIGVQASLLEATESAHRAIAEGAALRLAAADSSQHFPTVTAEAH